MRRLKTWRRGGGGGESTYLEFLQTHTLVPAALPLLFHPLDGGETLVGVVRASAGASLHGGKRCIGG